MYLKVQKLQNQVLTSPNFFLVCPEGYDYAGDDPKHRPTRDYVLDEAERSPVYSCYKIFDTPANWLDFHHLSCIAYPFLSSSLRHW